MPKLWAVSDLHVGHRGNKPITESIHPEDPGDWLIVAGDVAEKVHDVRWALELLRKRFAKVIWVPGNHELYTTSSDPVQMFGQSRYEYYVSQCREIDVVTPEDIYPLWEGAGGPVRIVPLFLLYDYTFLPKGTTDKLQALAYARSKNVVASDEYLLSAEPYPSRDSWCRALVEKAAKRLDALDPAEPKILINHWPLLREPTRVLHPREFCLWCGTTATADWHVKYNAAAVVYGHLHIPRTTWYDGVRFEEVSIGYPREWQRRGLPEPLLRQIWPDPELTEETVGVGGARFPMTPEMVAAAKAYLEGQ